MLLDAGKVRRLHLEDLLADLLDLPGELGACPVVRKIADDGAHLVLILLDLRRRSILRVMDK